MAAVPVREEDVNTTSIDSDFIDHQTRRREDFKGGGGSTVENQDGVDNIENGGSFERECVIEGREEEEYGEEEGGIGDGRSRRTGQEQDEQGQGEGEAGRGEGEEAGRGERDERTIAEEKSGGEEESLGEERREEQGEAGGGGEDILIEGDEERCSPESHIYTVNGVLGSYHGDSHLAMRMSAVCQGGLKDVDRTHPNIWALLPKGYDYHICAIEIPDPANPDLYKIGFRLPINNPIELDRWVEEYQRVSYTQWRIGHGNRKSKAVKVLYQRSFKCHHNIYLRKDKQTQRSVGRAVTWRGSQHTGCQAKLTIAIKVHVTGISKNRTSRARDTHMPAYPAMVSIHHTHNHQRQDEFALRFRVVDKSVDTMYTDLFKAGHSALTAHNFLQWKRWAEYGADYESMTLDRAFNPDLGYVYRIFYRMMRKRKPHILKPIKKKKGENMPSHHPTPTCMPTTTTTTITPTPVRLGSTPNLPKGLDSAVIMEGDEKEGEDASPSKKKRTELRESETQIDAAVVNRDGSISYMGPSLLPNNPSVLANNTSVLNSSELDAASFVEDEEGEEEEAEKDFFAHGYKTRIPGTNRARKMTVNLKELYEDLEQLVSKHVNETHPAHAHLARITGDRDDMIIAICTPLMRRAHTDTSFSGELCVVDSTFQSFGQNACYVISFVVPTNAGGLPLGFLVLSSMDQVFVTQGLELFKMLIPEDAFGCRGRNNGPAHFLSDEDHYLPEILQAAFPESKVSLSPYHLMMSAWRWIADSKRRIEPQDQLFLIDLVRELLVCRSAEEIQSIHLRVLGMDMKEIYRAFVPTVIETIMSRWQDWLLPLDHPIYRQGVGSHPWQMINNCLRDRVLMKGRHFNILQMTHFLLNGVDGAYERILLEGCKNAPSDLCYTPLFTDSGITRQGVKQLGPTKFLVNAKSRCSLTLLTVNSELGLCSCIAGKSSYFCPHLAAVLKFFNLPGNVKLPLTGSDKYQIYKVATGEKIVHEQLTETMQHLARVVEANMDALSKPVKHFIKQIERADSTSGLARAMEKFVVLTKEEEQEEMRRNEKERDERLNKEKEEDERLRWKNDEERMKLEEERTAWEEERRKERERLEATAEEWERRREERKLQKEKQEKGQNNKSTNSRRRMKGLADIHPKKQNDNSGTNNKRMKLKVELVEGKAKGQKRREKEKSKKSLSKNASSLNSSITSRTKSSSSSSEANNSPEKKEKREKRTRVEDAGKLARTPIMTPGRAVTRGVTRMHTCTDKEGGKYQKGLSSSLSSDAASTSSPSVRKGKR